MRNSYNIVGELPGADDETAIIGSHHDGPWASAVEDASGISLVLAQATYWSRVPASERPHRLVFLMNANHMTGGAGARAYVEAHRAEMEHVVLEVEALRHRLHDEVQTFGQVAGPGHDLPGRRARARNVAWKASSASASVGSRLRHCPHTSPP